MLRAVWPTVFVALAIAIIAACKRGDCEEHAVQCDGSHAQVCIDGKWTLQRCKSTCEATPFRCETVDDPNAGEACFDEAATREGVMSGPFITSCAADRRTLLRCNYTGGVWKVVRDCGDRGCEKASCL